MASFCRPWFLSGERVGLTGRKAIELCSCSVVNQTVWVCVLEKEEEREAENQRDKRGMLGKKWRNGKKRRKSKIMSLLAIQNKIGEE